MVEKCKPEYKNVNTVKSFKEQKAATVQVMNRICQNEEYLYQQSEKLKYLSPPAFRQRFNPVLIDEDYSYGWMLSDEGYVCFDKEYRKVLPIIDFTDLSLIDQVNSTCLIESGKATLPINTSYVENNDCKNWDLEGMNSAWYCGYDKNKPYQIRPDWIKNPFDIEVPAVCRAQTIVIPDSVDGNKLSFLEDVTLHIESQGESSDWGSPLYVQIFETESINVPVTEYKNNKNVPTGDSVSVYVPKGRYKSAPLATCVFNPSETSPINFTFRFDTPVRVKPGEHYAIVISSPLSHWDHCPRVGGWGRNCKVSKDQGGDAFLSEDNGRTWIRYGKNDDSLTVKDYKLGLRTPQDFAFQATIKTYEEVYDTENEYYLYLKPIRSSQIESLYLNAHVHGDVSSENCNVEFQVSTNNRDWFTPESALIPFEQDSQGNYPDIVFVRAVLTTEVTNDAPVIESIELILNKQPAQKMYVRTPFYNPKLSSMLGANVWGRVYAPFEPYPSNCDDVDCKVEIIQETPSKEHFHIITVNELHLYNSEDSEGIIIEDEGLVNDCDARAEYLIDNPSVIRRLKKQHVYVKPYTLDNTEYLLSFEDFDAEGNTILGGLKLDNSPAYPLHEVKIIPLGTEKEDTYGEGYDLNMDYEKDTLTIVREVLDDLPVGSLSVTYNKVFIQDLTSEEVGDRVDDETGLHEEGLILDYFLENLLIGTSELENRKVSLRVVPFEPLREVKILRGDDEIELYEDKDFTVNCKNKELIFKLGQLELNDILRVVYTPHLEDTGIAIGYTVTRKDINHQIKILPNYIEYK